MRPHFPLVAPPEYYALYDPASLPLPATQSEPLEQQHPAIRHLRWNFRNDEPISEELQRRATASYFALVTFLDAQIGRLLDALDRSGQAERTAVLYTSDHGEMGGQHGIWQKQCFYEAAVRVPLILAPAAAAAVRPSRVAENVSLIDLFPTLLDLAAVPPDRWPAGLRGRSLRQVAAESADVPARAVFSEYHAQGMLTGAFMIKRGDHKYCYYVGHPPQLFDVRRDPDERHDLASDPAHARLVEDLHGELLRIGDPTALDARAHADQARRLALLPTGPTNSA
jgi:choline-sulfatase